MDAQGSSKQHRHKLGQLHGEPTPKKQIKCKLSVQYYLSVIPIIIIIYIRALQRLLISLVLV